MVTLNVYNRQGDTVGTVDVDPAKIGNVVNKQLMHDVVIMHLANQRAGTHSTLRRGEVAGSTKKLFRQKGTGNARCGPKRTNKRRGGGTAKGPKPRDYEYHMPKKAVQAATRMAVRSKFEDNEVIILDELALTTPKTKQIRDLLKALKVSDTSCLIGTPEYDKNLLLAARNLEEVEVLPMKEFNTYTVLRQKRLVLTKTVLEKLLEGKKKTEATAPAETK